MFKHRENEKDIKHKYLSEAHEKFHQTKIDKLSSVTSKSRSSSLKTEKQSSVKPHHVNHSCKDHKTKKCQCSIKLTKCHFQKNGQFRPIVIDKPGRYVFCSNIDVAPLEESSVITITSSNVTLDFKHYYLNQTNVDTTSLETFIRVSGVTISRDVSDVTITGDSESRGKIRNFSWEGIRVMGDTSNITVTNMLITQDEQFPGFVNSLNFTAITPIGFVVADVDEDGNTSDKLTTNLRVTNVTAENYSLGCNFSRAQNVRIEKSLFIGNALVGLYLGNYFNTNVSTAEDVFIENIILDDVKCDENGFRVPGVVSPPVFGIDKWVDTVFGLETNRCVSIEIKNSSFSGNFSKIEETADTVYFELLRLATRGLDDDACQSVSVNNCRFDRNTAVVGSAEGYHLSGSFGNLRPNIAVDIRNSTFNQNSCVESLCTGFTFVYGGPFYLGNCVAQDNKGSSGRVAGFFLQGFNTSTDQQFIASVVENCTSLRNTGTGLYCAGFVLTNATGVVGDPNFSQGVEFRNCKGHWNLNTSSTGIGAGFLMAGQKAQGTILETDQQGLGPFEVLTTANSEPFVAPIIFPAGVVLPLGSCLPIAEDLSGKIALTQYTGECGSATLVANTQDANAEATIIIDNLTPTASFGGAPGSYNGSISQADGDLILSALESNPDIVLTIRLGTVSDDFISDVLIKDCSAINNGNRTTDEGGNVSAGFKLEGLLDASAVERVVVQDCVSLRNYGHGYLSTLTKDCIIKFSEADNNTISGFTDEEESSTGVYLGNLAVKNPIQYAVQYPAPLEVATGTASALPSPVDKITNVAIDN